MQRTIFDSQLEHCVQLLAKEPAKIVVEDARRKLFQLAQIYDRETTEYWLDRLEPYFKLYERKQ